MQSSSCDGARFGVALVYPPFAPSGIASLGLALLSAGLKARGIDCATFYWNLELIAAMPGADLATRIGVYRSLTNRYAMPFNEWIFAEAVHGEVLRHREASVIRALDEMLRAVYGQTAHARLVGEAVLTLRRSVAQELDLLVERLAPYNLVGVNSTFFQNLPALALAKRLKQRWPGKTVVMGGANCDGEMGPALAEKFPFLDAVFVGEADHSFPGFVERVSRGANFDDIPGIVFRDSGRVLCATPPGALATDLDSSPIPDFDDYLRTRREVGIAELQELTLPLESSRGCWWGARHHCTFCGLNANGMPFRQKTADRFEDEIRQIYDRYGARYLFMTDNILSMDYFGGFMQRAASHQRPVRMFYEIKANANRDHSSASRKRASPGCSPGSRASAPEC
jgi:ribosomal peptide maturation radical SAM protein 1